MCDRQLAGLLLQGIPLGDGDQAGATLRVVEVVVARLREVAGDAGVEALVAAVYVAVVPDPDPAVFVPWARERGH